MVGAAAAVTLAVPAHADPINVNNAFLAALSRAGIGYNDPTDAISLGQRVCPMLVEPGKSIASVYSTVTNNGINPAMAAFFTGIAIQMYCPQMINSLGNGTILQFLQAPHL